MGSEIKLDFVFFVVVGRGAGGDFFAEEENGVTEEAGGKEDLVLPESDLDTVEDVFLLAGTKVMVLAVVVPGCFPREGWTKGLVDASRKARVLLAVEGADGATREEPLVCLDDMMYDTGALVHVSRRNITNFFSFARF